MLSIQILGGKWKESAQCVRKYTHLGGSPGKFFILQPLRLLLVASESIYDDEDNNLLATISLYIIMKHWLIQL